MRTGHRGLIRQDPRVERPADRPEVFERGDGKAAARHREQAHGLGLELVEAAVVERGLQHRRVRPVVHRRPEDDGVGRAHVASERGGVTRVLVVHVGVQGGQVVLAQVEQFGVAAVRLDFVQGAFQRDSSDALVSQTAAESDDVRWICHTPRLGARRK